MYKFVENLRSKIKNLKPLTKGISIGIIVIAFYTILFAFSSETTNQVGSLNTTRNNNVNEQTISNSETTEQVNTNSTNTSVSDDNTNTFNTKLYKVIRVVDGDTLIIDYNGTEERVRLIGVDTPESVHPNEEKNTKFGKKASEFSKNYLENKEVTLEFDVQERDQYGRLLAYVYLNNVMYNKTLLQEGYAKIATYPPNVKYVDDFTAIQEEARNNKKGLWGYETTSNTSKASPKTSSSNTTTTNTTTTSTVDSDSNNSGNIEYNGQTVYKSKTGSKYHYSPTCSNMKNPTEITLEEAENLGLEPCKNCVL